MIDRMLSSHWKGVGERNERRDTSPELHAIRARRLPAIRIATGDRVPGEEGVAPVRDAELFADDVATVPRPDRIDLHLEEVPVPELFDEPAEPVLRSPREKSD